MDLPHDLREFLRLYPVPLQSARKQFNLVEVHETNLATSDIGFALHDALTLPLHVTMAVVSR